MEIKQINLSDSHLVIDLFNKYRVFYKQESDKKLASKFISDRLKKSESIIFVALIPDNGQIIPAGFTQLYPKYSSVRATKNWILNDLYVDAEFRKQGIGESLVKAAMEFAKGRDANFVQLETAKDNYTAQKLYEAMGFKKQAPESDFFTYRIEVASGE